MSPTIFMLGACFMLFFWWLSKRYEANYFIEKSDPKYRTPVRIKDGFYYIIPEAEYVELDLLRVREVTFVVKETALENVEAEKD